MDSSTPLERVAWVVSCLPDQEAEQLLQRLPARQAADIRRRSLAVTVVDDARTGILEQFISECAPAGPTGTRHRIDAASAPAALHILQRELPSRVAALLANELPQTVAAILGSLPPSQAADILTHMSRDTQRLVAVHLRDRGAVADEVITDLTTALGEQLQDEGVVTSQRGDGRRQLDAMLAYADDATRQYIEEGLPTW